METLAKTILLILAVGMLAFAWHFSHQTPVDTSPAPQITPVSQPVETPPVNIQCPPAGCKG